jgi:hypothetical protein
MTFQYLIVLNKKAHQALGGVVEKMEPVIKSTGLWL